MAPLLVSTPTARRNSEFGDASGLARRRLRARTDRIDSSQLTRENPLSFSLNSDLSLSVFSFCSSLFFSVYLLSFAGLKFEERDTWWPLIGSQGRLRATARPCHHLREPIGSLGPVGSRPLSGQLWSTLGRFLGRSTRWTFDPIKQVDFDQVKRLTFDPTN